MSKWRFSDAKETKYSTPPPQQVSHAEILSLQTLMQIKESIGELRSDINECNHKIDKIDGAVKDIKGSVTTIESDRSFLKGIWWTIAGFFGLGVIIFTAYYHFTRIDHDTQQSVTMPTVTKKTGD